MEKDPTSPLNDDRSTKKAKFRAQGDDGNNPEQVSFRDKLMESQKMNGEEMMGEEEDMIFELEDIVVGDNGNLPSISFSKRIHDQLVKPWQQIVVVKLLGRSIGYKALCNRLETLWKIALGFSIIDLENDYCLVRFRSGSDADFALTQGPWTIMGHYLVVQPWTPHFGSAKETIDSVIAWIRLRSMALHYYHKRILRMIGQIVGEVVRIDYNTESAMRGKLARIAVVVALNKPLVSKFLLDSKVQKVEYECLPHICFTCDKYVHNSDLCPKRTTEPCPLEALGRNLGDNKLENTGAVAARVNFGSNPKFRSWMVVTRKGRNRSVIGKEILRESRHGQWSSDGKESRFGVLARSMKKNLIMSET